MQALAGRYRSHGISGAVLKPGTSPAAHTGFFNSMDFKIRTLRVTARLSTNRRQARQSERREHATSFVAPARSWTARLVATLEHCRPPGFQLVITNRVQDQSGGIGASKGVLVKSSNLIERISDSCSASRMEWSDLAIQCFGRR